MSTRCVTIKNGCLRLHFVRSRLCDFVETGWCYDGQICDVPRATESGFPSMGRNCGATWCSITNTVNPLLSSPLSNNPPASNKPPFSEEEN